MQTAVFIGAFFTWLTLFVGVAAPVAAAGKSITLIDQAGRPVTVAGAVSRIVSLAPSVTEIVYALGRGDRLVAATQYSTYPEEAKKLPRIGSYVRLDLERIVAMRPDLCIAVKDGNPRHQVERVASMGIPVFVLDPTGFESMIDGIGRLGQLLGVEAEAGEIVAGMRQRIGRVTSRVAKVAHRPRVFFQIDAAPMVSAGSATFIGEMITLAGGDNTAAGETPYPRFSWEDVLAMAPEVVIIASMAGGHSEEELTSQWKKWPQVPAVKNGRLYVVDANLIDRPSPRLVESLELFTAIIHPGLDGDQRE